MNRRLAVLAWAVLLGSGWASAQEAPAQEELRFVRELRARHFNDLALEFLEKLSKTAPPELARELPLEVAKTRLEGAADEPDSAKRLAEYTKAQAEFEKFLKENKDHPRSGEVTLDLAQVAVQRGRTQLSRAFLQDSPEGRAAEGAKAREMLVKAAQQLQQAAAVLDAQIAKTPDTTPQEKAAKKRLENERLRAELSKGLNLFDQGQSYSKSDASNEILLARAKPIGAAQKVLEKVAEVDDTNPICWVAKAWAGRCWNELGEPKKAREHFTQILESSSRAAGEGQRLARYFRLLVIKEQPEPMEKPIDIILEAGNRWLTDYPGYLKTPEGYGMRYLLAEVLAEKAETLKTAAEKTPRLAAARKLLSEVESTENDFTDRARRLKIRIIGQQGGFTLPVAELKNFDDCYVRAQYEIMQIGEAAKKVKDAAELAKVRKEHAKTLMAALDKALKMPEAKKPSPEAANAKALFAFYALNAGKYKDAIRVGEDFARREPKAAQAAMAAVYALQSYIQMLADPDSTGGDDVKDGKERMLSLAQYMKDRWDKELAGNMARHQLGLKLLKEVKYPEAIAELDGITPAYPSYSLAQFQLAEAAFSAEKERAKPLPGDDYRKRALDALGRIPEPAAGDEPLTNHVYLLAKVRLTREMYKTKKYDEMLKMAEALSAKLPKLVCDADKTRDQAVHNQLAFEIQDASLYARYGQADAAFTANQFPQVAAVLDPMVKEVNEGKIPHFKKNPQLGMALLNMALKADIQLGQLDKAREVLKALQSLTAEVGAGAEAGSSAILTQLALLIGQQVEELRKKNNEADLKKAIAGFDALLGDIVKQTPSPTPKFVMQLARCYSNMELHKKAAELLAKAVEPPAGSPDVGLYHGIRLMLVRELRLNKESAEAHKVLDEIIGTKEKKGWGQRDLGAQKERIFLLEEDGKYVDAALMGNALVKQLLPRAGGDNAMKENYLECYYHVAYCFLKHGQAQEDSSKKAALIKKAAEQVVQLEKKWEGFGSEASKKRFEELLAKEPQLKEQYDQLKAAGK